MVASRGACLNRVASTHAQAMLGAHFDNSERPAGGGLCIYCVWDSAFVFLRPAGCVLDPWGVVAKWAGREGSWCVGSFDLRELQKSMNSTLAKSESGA